MREIGRGLELPALAALDQLDAAPLVVRFERRAAPRAPRPRRRCGAEIASASAAPRQRTASPRPRAARSSGSVSLMRLIACRCSGAENLLLRAVPPCPAARSSSAATKLTPAPSAAAAMVGWLGRQEVLQFHPVERHAEHRRDALDRRIERHHHRGRDHVHARLGARLDLAIGLRRGRTSRIASRFGGRSCSPSGAPRSEHVAADPVARHQPRRRLAHRAQPLRGAAAAAAPVPRGSGLPALPCGSSSADLR